jgi:hypothetical protein
MIGLDLQFIGRSDPADDSALLAAIARDGPVVLATLERPRSPEQRSITVPIFAADAPGAVVASAGIEEDPDGVLRRMVYAPLTLQTFAVRAAEMYRHESVGPYEFPGNHAWIDFRGPPGTRVGDRGCEHPQALEQDDAKSEDSERTLPIPEALRAELKAARKRQATEELALGAVYRGDGYVVCNEAGEPYHPDTLSRCGAKRSPRRAYRISGCTTRGTPAAPPCTCKGSRPR